MELCLSVHPSVDVILCTHLHSILSLIDILNVEFSLLAGKQYKFIVSIHIYHTCSLFYNVDGG